MLYKPETAKLEERCFFMVKTWTTMDILKQKILFLAFFLLNRIEIKEGMRMFSPPSFQNAKIDFLKFRS